MCKYYEEIKDNGFSKIFKCPFCNQMIEIFWNGEINEIPNYSNKRCE